MIGRVSQVVACVLVLSFAIMLALPARAHDVRPAYLQIDPMGPEGYSLIWRTPVLSGVPLPVVLALPDGAEAASPPSVQNLPGSRIERRVIVIPGGLGGQRIQFVGLETTITDVLVRVSDKDGNYWTDLVRPSRPWFDLDPDRNALDVALTYLRQGIDHIFMGIDHLFFVLALLLVVRDWRMLVKTVTAFTLAHSITLALATLGHVRLPAGPVEIMIAASIVLVAVEAVRREQGQMSLTMRRPWIVAFAFGLLHGFGFAGALQDLGLPQSDVPLALLMFNLGVETGQLVFVGFVLTLAAAARRFLVMPARSALVCSYILGITATYWMFERLQSTFAQGPFV